MRIFFWIAIAMLMGRPWFGTELVLEDATNPVPAGAQTAAPLPSGMGQSEPDKTDVQEDKKKATVKEKKKTGAQARRGIRHRTRKAAAQPAASNGPHRIVIREGGTGEPSAQIVPGIAPEEAAKQRQSAEGMLVSAGDHLKLLEGRALDSTQQETVTQIRNYMEKAHSALKDGDTQRGHTLALKAYLLADDLVKH